MGKSAEVSIGVKGAAQAERDVKKLEDAFKNWGKELGGIFAGVARDFGHIGTSLAQVDPARAAERFRDHRKTVTEFAIATKRSVDDVKSSFASLGDRTLLPDDQVADFSRALAKSTYDMGDSRKAIESLRGSGLETGRSLDEMGGIAEALHNQMGTSLNDIPEMMGRIEASANALGTAGGPAALQDSIVALGSSLNAVAIKGKNDANDLIATLAAVGKGMRPEQQRGVQQALVNRFTSGGEQMRLNLGIKREDFYDENGGVKVTAQNVQRLRDFYLRRTGGNLDRAKSLAAFGGNLGPQLGAALFRPGLMDNIKTASTAVPGGGAQKALDSLLGSAHGVDEAARLKREREERENLGSSVNAVQQKAAGALSDSSVARYFELAIGGGVAQAGISRILGSTFGDAGASVARSLFKVNVAAGQASVGLTGLGSGVSALGKVTGAVTALMAGYAAGKWLDEKTNLSGKIVDDTAVGRALKAVEDRGVEANRGLLAKKDTEKKARVAALEAQGFSHGKAVNLAEHPSAKTIGQMVELKVTVANNSAHPDVVVNFQKGSAGQQ